MAEKIVVIITEIWVYHNTLSPDIVWRRISCESETHFEHIKYPFGRLSKQGKRVPFLSRECIITFQIPPLWRLQADQKDPRKHFAHVEEQGDTFVVVAVQ